MATTLLAVLLSLRLRSPDFVAALDWLGLCGIWYFERVHESASDDLVHNVLLYDEPAPRLIFNDA